MFRFVVVAILVVRHISHYFGVILVLMRIICGSKCNCNLHPKLSLIGLRHGVRPSITSRDAESTGPDEREQQGVNI